MTESDITSLTTCATEFLPIIFNDLSLLVIICYHPFWNDIAQHNTAIDCLLDILDYVAVNKSFPSALRILVVGDFNDLSKFSNTISSLTGLCPSVSFPTRGHSVLDQLFSNFNVDYLPPEKLSPIGRSDHCSFLWCPLMSRSNFRKVQVRQFNKSACANFYDVISRINWTEFFRNDISLEYIVVDFHDCVKYLFDLFFRVKTVRVRDFEPPWMSYALKILINDCDRAFSSKNQAKFLR